MKKPTFIEAIGDNNRTCPYCRPGQPCLYCFGTRIIYTPYPYKSRRKKKP